VVSRLPLSDYVIDGVPHHHPHVSTFNGMTMARHDDVILCLSHHHLTEELTTNSKMKQKKN